MEVKPSSKRFEFEVWPDPNKSLSWKERIAHGLTTSSEFRPIWFFLGNYVSFLSDAFVGDAQPGGLNDGLSQLRREVSDPGAFRRLRRGKLSLANGIARSSGSSLRR